MSRFRVYDRNGLKKKKNPRKKQSVMMENSLSNLSCPEAVDDDKGDVAQVICIVRIDARPNL